MRGRLTLLSGLRGRVRVGRRGRVGWRSTTTDLQKLLHGVLYTTFCPGASNRLTDTDPLTTPSA